MKAPPIVLLSALLTVPSAAATELSFSVFGTLGYAVSDRPYHYQRFIDEHGTFTRDTLVGAQLDVKFADKFGATVQVKAAPSTTSDNQYQVTVPWAFMSWRPTNDWLFRAGKQRIPLYLYSETVDVGVTYDFARLPTEMYSIVSSNDVKGISVNKTWAPEGGEISFEAYWGKFPEDLRFWRRDNIPPFQTTGATFVQEDATGWGAVLSYKPADDIYRISVHRATFSNLRGVDFGGRFPISYPFVALAPGIGYYQVFSTLPGPGVPTVASFTDTAVTAGGDVSLGSGFRVIGEIARTWSPDTDISAASTRGYVSLFKRIDQWAPYVVYAFLRSAPRPRDFYLNVNYNTVPDFIPGAQNINASQRAGADFLLAWDQHSWSVGTSYSVAPNIKIKAEYQRAHIGEMSPLLVDAPSGSNIRNQDINVFTVNLNVVF